MNWKLFLLAFDISAIITFVILIIVKIIVPKIIKAEERIKKLIEAAQPIEAVQFDDEEAAQPLYKNIRLFQHFKLHDEEEDYYIFNEMFYEAANLVIMTIGISHNYLRERMSTEIGGLMDEMDDEILEEFFPSIYCEDADIIERKNGQKLDYYIRCHVKPIRFEKDI